MSRRKEPEYHWDLVASFLQDDEKFMEAWEEWIQFRAWELKKPVGPIAAKKQLKFLRDQPAQHRVGCIDQSINSGWTGLFPFRGRAEQREFQGIPVEYRRLDD